MTMILRTARSVTPVAVAAWLVLLQPVARVAASVCAADWSHAACDVPVQHFNTANVSDGLVTAEECSRFCEGIGIVATGSETACCSFVTPRGVVAGSGVCTAFHVAAAELISLGGAAATTTAMATLCVGRGGQRMPHVLVVVLDDAGFNDFDWSPGNAFETPVMRGLMVSGVALGAHYSQSVCAPSRFSLNTGRHSAGLGLQRSNIKPDEGVALDLETETVAEAFTSRGYKTHGFGKWHLGHGSRVNTPTYRGFDTWYGGLTGSGDHWEHTKAIRKVGLGFVYDCSGVDLRACDGDVIVTDFSKNGTHSTDLFSDAAVQVITDHDTDRSAFFYVAYTAPHTPYQALDHLVDHFADVYPPISTDCEGGDPEPCRHPRAVPAAMMLHVDQGIGQIIDALTARGMWEDTVTVVISDNGAARKINGNAGTGGTDDGIATMSNFPLRGGKGSPFEGGMRTTGILHITARAGPGGYPKRWAGLPAEAVGSSYNELFFITDWMPTLLDATGDPLVVRDREADDFDGVSHWHTLTDATTKTRRSPRAEILMSVYECGSQFCGAIRIGDFKLLLLHQEDPFFDWVSADAARVEHQSQFEPAVCGRAIERLDLLGSSAAVSLCVGVPCVFNIAEDPCERTDLASSMPGLVARLQARLNTFGEAAPNTRANKVSVGCDAVSIYGDWGLWRDEDTAIDLSRYRELESIGATFGWRDALSSSVFHLWDINVSTCIATCNAEKSCHGLYFYSHDSARSVMQCKGMQAYEGQGEPCLFHTCKSYTRIRWDDGSCEVPGTPCEWNSQCCGMRCTGPPGLKTCALARVSAEDADPAAEQSALQDTSASDTDAGPDAAVPSPAPTPVCADDTYPACESRTMAECATGFFGSDPIYLVCTTRCCAHNPTCGCSQASTPAPTPAPIPLAVNCDHDEGRYIRVENVKPKKRWLVRIRSIATTSLAACMAFCTEDSACVGFGFHPRQMTCDLRKPRQIAKYIVPVVSGDDRRVTGSPRWDAYFLHAECFQESAAAQMPGAGNRPTPQDKRGHP